MTNLTPADTTEYRVDEQSGVDIREVYITESDTKVGEVHKEGSKKWRAYDANDAEVTLTRTKKAAVEALLGLVADEADEDESPAERKPRKRLASLSDKFSTREVWERIKPLVADLKAERDLPRNAGVEFLMHADPRTSEDVPSRLSHAVTRRGDVVGSITPLEAEQSEQVRPFGSVVDIRLSRPGKVGEREVVDTVTVWMGDLDNAPVVVCNDPVADGDEQVGAEHVDEVDEAA